MIPIPAGLLIHNGELVTEYAPDLWGNSSDNETAPLLRIRIEPCHSSVTTKEMQQIALSAMLFFDAKNSVCSVPFLLEGDTYNGKSVKLQYVIWNGRKYTVQTVEPIYDSRKIHHYEVGLI